MSIEDATVIVLVYVLVSMGVIIASLLAVSLIGRFIGRLRQHRRNSAEKSNLTGGGRAGAFFGQTSEL